jgi:diguanylate cyclase (GGDEF)-like protein
MHNPSVLIALGPCLLLAMAAVALWVVYRRLSRTPQAIIWSGAFAAGAAQWGIMAARGLLGGTPLHGGLAADLFGLVNTLLFVEGFRVRAGRPQGVLLPIVGVIGACILIVTAFLPPMALRAMINPSIAALVVGWASTMVTSRGDTPAVTELAVTGLLSVLAVIHGCAAILAVLEHIGLVTDHGTYVLLYAATIEPICASAALLTLLLIAYDFSAELRRLIHTDPLTGVLNRLGFDHAVRKLLRGRRRRARAISLAIADIDHFKQINDHHGHAAGDAALEQFATHLSGRLARGSVVARIGGEEFVVLLPDENGATAFDKIDPVRASLTELRLEAHPAVRVGASFGIAERHPGEPIETLLQRADAALYLSKRAGRNRSTLASRSLPE